MWLQDVDYAFPDDQVMFYKMHLQKNRIVGISGLDFIHLDVGGNSPGRSVKTSYAASRNKKKFGIGLFIRHKEMRLDVSAWYAHGNGICCELHL